MAKVNVKKAKLYTENDKWYIDVTYWHEDDYYVKEVRIPKMHIPLEAFTGNIEHYLTSSAYGEPTQCEFYAELGRLSMACIGETFKPAYIEKTIEEKTQEMTLDEIEKKLGYKIKIVNKK